MRLGMTIGLACGTSLLVGTRTVHAQLTGGPYAIQTLDISGGGTTSTGGPYSISASTGQAGGVGTITAEPAPAPPLYQFDDGFWSTITDTPPTVPLPDPSNPDKCRFISFSIPIAATAAAGETALRVKLVSLHHVDPPYTGGASVPFTAFEGQVRWVGPPTRYVESESSGVPFYASPLQCAPYYQDWSTIGLLHVTGSAIVPSSTYDVENLAGSCAGNEASCAAVSAPLQINTTRWGDIVEPYNPTDPSSQPNFADIGALVNKFKSALGAPIKARALLASVDINGVIDITPDVGFTHISACVDAFKGLPYPYTIASCP